MKKTLFLLFFAALAVESSAQIVEFVDPQNVFYGDIANVGEELHPGWEVVNVSGEDRYIGSRMNIQQLVSGATYQFCWGELCSPWVTEDYLSSEEVFIPNGQTNNTFFAKYRHNGNVGQSVVSYCWFDANALFTDVCYEVNYCVSSECILGVEEAAPTARIETISPNPVQSTGVISYSFTGKPSSGKIIICNTLGAVIKEIPLTAKHGAVLIGGAEFPDGLYFVSIQESGRIYQTSRMLIQH